MFKTTDISLFLKSLLIYPPSTKDLVSSLKVGDELDAKIIKFTDSNKVLVSLKNFEVTAEVSIPFSEGETIKVRVESLTPRVILKLISMDAAIRDAYLKLFGSGNPDNRDFSDIFHELRGLFLNSRSVNFLPKRETIIQLLKILLSIFDFTEGGFTGDKVRQLIKNFSMSYEREIAQSAASKDPQVFALKEIKGNLKFLLLNLLELLEISSGDDGETDFAEGKKLTRFIKGMLHNLDIHHIQGQQSDARMLLFQVPIVFGEEKSKLDFVMDFKDKNGAGESTDIEITIFTELTGLGKMRISILLKENQVFSSITLFDRSSADFLKGNLDILSKALSGLGLEECNFYTNILCDENPETYIVDSKRFFQKVPIVDFHV